MQDIGHSFNSPKYELIISLVQKLKGIIVSHLDKFQLTENLSVNDSQVIIYSLVEDHMIYYSVDLVTNCSESFDTIDINVLQKSINFLVIVNFMDESSQKLN